MTERTAHESEEVEIVGAHHGDRLNDARTLLHAYVGSLAREGSGREAIALERIDDELAALPGVYAPPEGLLLVALVDGVASGCIALRRLDDDVAEIKRLYVDPQHRGMSLGHKLVDEVIERARSLRYRMLRLDMLPFMRGAARLYRSFDFEETEPYRDSYVSGTRFFERVLDNR